MNKETAEIYNELIENSADKTLEQCDEYITEYEMRSYASGYNNNITAAVNKYKTELRSCFMVESIRSYARTGRGLTDANIPSDLVKNSRLYAAFPTPLRYCNGISSLKPFVSKIKRVIISTV